MAGPSRVTHVLAKKLMADNWLICKEQAVITLTAGATIYPKGTYQPLNSATAITTSTSTAIADGDVVGQLLILINENASAAITIDDGGNTKLSGDAVLGAKDSLVVIWDGADWLELAQANVT